MCVYIWIYECISISIHLHTFYNIYFLLCSPWPPKSFTPTQPLAHPGFHRSEVRWPSSLLGTLQRVRDAQWREWRKKRKGWPGFNGSKWRTRAAKYGPKSLTSVFFFRWVIKKVVKLQCHYPHVVSSTFFLFGNKFLGPQCLNSLVS